MADLKCPNCGSTKRDDELSDGEAIVCGKCSTAFTEAEADPNDETAFLRTKGDVIDGVPAYDPAHDVELDPKVAKVIAADETDEPGPTLTLTDKPES
jgi:transcription initiation factor TFIIIB Brf1 subunit/transcription initiation factor TFIIB